jgi:hypothetical protein
MEGVMQSVKRAAVIVAAGLAVGCATLNTDNEPRPVGTTGTVDSARGPETVATDARPNQVPVGQQLDVRLQTPLSSETARVEDRFEATTVADLLQGDRVLVPAGSRVRGVVTAVDSAGRVDRTGRLVLGFDQITIRGRDYPMRALATNVFKTELEGELPRAAAGAGVGAIVGGIIGGLEGALAGVLIGGGGAVAATEGRDVVLPSGTIIRLRFDTPLELPGPRES